MDWPLALTHVRYDKDDVAYALLNGKDVKVGDIMYTNVRSIGPICITEDHWSGQYLAISKEQAEWIKEACEAYEKTKPFPI